MKTQNLVFGRSSGSLGNVVASALYGENVVRSKPLEVYNPQTAKQTNMRTIMADVVKIAKAANKYLAITKRTARTGHTKKMSAYAYLIKDILAAKTGTTPNIVLRPGGIILGTGDLAATNNVAATIDISTKECVFSFNSTPSDNQSEEDLCTAIVLNLTTGKVVVDSRPIHRMNGSDNFGLPTGFCGLNDDVAFFAAFESADGTLWDAPVSVAATVQA